MENNKEIAPTANVDSIASSKTFLATVILGCVSCLISYWLCNESAWYLFFNFNILPYDYITLFIWIGTALLTPLVSYLLLGVLISVFAIIMRIIYGKIKT